MKRATLPASPAPTQALRPPDAGRRVTLIASVTLVAVGLFLAAFPNSARTTFERLEKDPQRASEWQVTGNTVYRVNVSRQEIAVTATPVRGGLPKSLYKFSRQAWVPMDIRFVGDEAWILVRPITLTDGTQLGSMLNMDMAPDTKRGYGDFMARFESNEYLAAGPVAGVKGERRPRPIRYYKGQVRPTLHRVSLRDGTLRTKQLDVGGYLLDNVARCLTPTGLYWVRPGVEEVADVAGPDMTRTERAAKDTVLLTPLDGGPPRELCSGVSLTMLIASGDGACGRQPSVYPRTRHDLYQFSPAGATVVKNYEGFEAPVRANGRLYWAENHPEGLDESGPYARIVSSRPDGGDRQTVTRLESSAEKPRYLMGLFEQNARLYAILVSKTRGRRSGAGASPLSELRDDVFLFSVEPGDADPLSQAARLPDSVKFSRPHLATAYLYFYFVERWNNPVDFMFERVMQRARVTLCRVVLPQ